MVFLYPARPCLSEIESPSEVALNLSEEGSPTDEVDWTNSKKTLNVNSSENKITGAPNVCGKANKKFAFIKAALSKSSSTSHPLIISMIRKDEKRKNPARLALDAAGRSNSWVCKNSSCRASVSIDDTFCKRCSCCICHLFDKNKDPGLWLVCASESGDRDNHCGLSCHLKCAIRCSKVGVFNLDNLMQLDGSYCCPSCGKVSGIIGCWRKQLIVAKDACRLNVLCYRLYLSYKLLAGTCQFKDVHEIVKEAKARLETQVGLLNQVSAKKVRGMVSRLPVAGLVQKLCTLAIKRADEMLATSLADSRPAACRFLFEQVTPSSVTIILIEVPSMPPNDVKGYKLWYYKSEEETLLKVPLCIFPRSQRRFLISNLQPCTEYTFRVISYSTEAGDLGHTQAKCFTKSVEILNKSPGSVRKKFNSTGIEGNREGVEVDSKTAAGAGHDSSAGFRVRELGKQVSREGFWNGSKEKCCCAAKPYMNVDEDNLRCVSGGLDLNVVLVPDLNDELSPSDRAIEADEAPAPAGSGKRAAINSGEERRDNSLINYVPPLKMLKESPCWLDENYEKCVKIFRWLECEGHIDKEFRVKLVTWVSLRATEQERSVVNTFIQTLIDEPSCLAGQLVDSFSDIVST